MSSIGRPFIPGPDHLAPFAAELWLIAAIVGVLVAPFLTRRAGLVVPLVAAAGVVLGLGSLLLLPAAHAGGVYYRGLLVADDVAYLWKILLLVFVGGVILLYWSAVGDDDDAARDDDDDGGGDAAEFFTLLLGATLGMSLMASASNLLMIYLALELASLPSYVLAGFRKTTRAGAEAALKYVLFGAAASAVMVYGMSLLYGLYGTLDLPTLARHIVATPGDDPASAALLSIGLLGLLVGVGFKLAAVPLHYWCPDVFEGARVDVAAFLSVASKGAALVLLLRVALSVADAAGYQPGAQPVTAIAVALGVIGAVTATVGNTAAFFQNDVKRLLAYSSVAHAGYMICGVSLLVRARPDFAVTTAATQAVLLYLAVYLFMNLGAFAVVGVVGRMTGRTDLVGFTGLGRQCPLLGGVMFVLLVSLIGLPPTGGFTAKVNLLWALAGNGSWYWALVGVVAVNTVVSAFYYFRVARAMYLTAPPDPSDPASPTGASPLPPLRPHPLGVTLAGACAVVLILMLVRWDPLADITTRYSRFHLPAEPPATTSATAAATLARDAVR